MESHFKTKHYAFGPDLCRIKRIYHEIGKSAVSGFQNCIPLILFWLISHLVSHKRKRSWYKWLVSCWSPHCSFSSLVSFYIITVKINRWNLLWKFSEDGGWWSRLCILLSTWRFSSLLALSPFCLHSGHYFSYLFKCPFLHLFT